MKSIKRDSVGRINRKMFLCFLVIIFSLGTRLTTKAAEADSNDRGHTHVFNQHYDLNAGYTVDDPHQFVYGYNAGDEPILKTCYSYFVHEYFRVGCACGISKPGEPNHDHVTRKNHPLTSDPNDCKLGSKLFQLPTDCLY